MPDFKVDSQGKRHYPSGMVTRPQKYTTSTGKRATRYVIEKPAPKRSTTKRKAKTTETKRTTKKKRTTKTAKTEGGQIGALVRRLGKPLLKKVAPYLLSEGEKFIKKKLLGEGRKKKKKGGLVSLRSGARS